MVRVRLFFPSSIHASDARARASPSRRSPPFFSSAPHRRVHVTSTFQDAPDDVLRPSKAEEVAHDARSVDVDVDVSWCACRRRGEASQEVAHFVVVVDVVGCIVHVWFYDATCSMERRETCTYVRRMVVVFARALGVRNKPRCALCFAWFASWTASDGATGTVDVVDASDEAAIVPNPAILDVDPCIMGVAYVCFLFQRVVGFHAFVIFTPCRMPISQTSVFLVVLPSLPCPHVHGTFLVFHVRVDACDGHHHVGKKVRCVGYHPGRSKVASTATTMDTTIGGTFATCPDEDMRDGLGSSSSPRVDGRCRDRTLGGVVVVWGRPVCVGEGQGERDTERGTRRRESTPTGTTCRGKDRWTTQVQNQHQPSDKQTQSGKGKGGTRSNGTTGWKPGRDAGKPAGMHEERTRKNGHAKHKSS